jgi:YegS/Rv2252/BmrU family lipid kinase
MSATETATLIGVAAAVVVLFVLFLLMLRHGPRWTADAEHAEQPPTPPEVNPRSRLRRAAVVVNPTKFDGDTTAVRKLFASICAAHGWAPPLWLETTAEDPGVGQTRQALREHVDVVIACGGDGTVRLVAQVIAGSGTALGLLPAGTGNLLARNLDMDSADMATAMRTALTGGDRPVDVGWVTVTGPDGANGAAGAKPQERAFLVMAGMGFDAAIMANAPEELKARVGPIAYVVSGLRHLRGTKMRVRIEVDDTHSVQRRVRTVVVGNCGRLLGGLVLMPDAEIDDGWLDAVSIAPKNIVGWAAVAGRVLTKRRRGHRRVEHWRGRRITITADEPQPAQLDGDPVGEAAQLAMRIDPAALLVRVPEPAR